MQFSVVAAMSFQKGRSSGRSSTSARSPVSVSVDPALEDADVERLVAGADGRALAERLEAVQAEVVAAPLHAGGGERDAERLAQHRQVLEEDLFLEILGAGRDEHALAAEDRRHEVGERLAGAGARFGEQHAARREDRGDGFRHLHLARARLEPVERSRQRTVGGKRLDGRVGQLRDSGYSGNFRHRASILSRTAASDAVVVRGGRARGDEARR